MFFGLSCVDWAVRVVAQLREWFELGRGTTEYAYDEARLVQTSAKTELKQLRRRAPDSFRPLCLLLCVLFSASFCAFLLQLQPLLSSVSLICSLHLVLSWSQTFFRNFIVLPQFSSSPHLLLVCFLVFSWSTHSCHCHLNASLLDLHHFLTRSYLFLFVKQLAASITYLIRLDTHQKRLQKEADK